MFITKWNNSDEPLVRFDPFRALSLLDYSPRLAHESRSSRFSPLVNVSETDTEYKITLETPGLDKDEIKIEIEQDTLTLSGEKKESSEQSDEKFYRFERKYGAFTRSFRFADIDSDKVLAEYHNGVLTVTVSKAEAVKPKQISIT